MNELHHRLLASVEWQHYLETDVLPWVAGQADLGGEVLEVGPGPGLTTDLLCRDAARVVAVELDARLAAQLSERLGGTNVTVVCADATEPLPWVDRFSAATCFTMLHHVPSPEAQDALFVAVLRALRPGGTFVGVDSSDSPELRALHADDVFVPVDPGTLGGRLEAAGFGDVVVEEWVAASRPGPKVRFAATRPHT